MKRALTLTGGPASRLRLLAVLLAFAGQLGLLGAYLGLARDESSAISHVEQGGTSSHHGHSEATCIACTALSFHATVTPASQPIPVCDAVRLVFARADANRPAAPQLHPNSCRAPPREA